MEMLFIVPVSAWLTTKICQYIVGTSFVDSLNRNILEALPWRVIPLVSIAFSLTHYIVSLYLIRHWLPLFISSISIIGISLGILLTTLACEMVLRTSSARGLGRFISLFGGVHFGEYMISVTMRYYQ